MTASDLSAFAALFREVVTKCFGHPLARPLSEPESRRLSSEIEEATGLVIGWKSLKNYAAFVLGETEGRQENPSIPTLDTLARYVLEAAPTTEVQRKKNGADYAFWFRYKEQDMGGDLPTVLKKQRSPRIWLWAGLVLGILLLLIVFLKRKTSREKITEDFHSVTADYLAQNGWLLQSPNPAFWNKRDTSPGCLTLFTLQGDNWPKTGETPRIQNLLLREIHDDCFATEVHFADFIPHQNWQQAGLLLLEDTTFTGKSIRLSISYNDFFGGFTQPGEIIVQGIASYGKGYSTLEEIIHQSLFTLNEKDDPIVAENLRHSAVRIEKQGRKFRFLYSASPNENFSFKGLTTYEFDMTPRYVGIFALKGFVDSTEVMPVTVRFFRLDGCEENY